MRRKVWKVETSGTVMDVAAYAMPNENNTSDIKLRLSQGEVHWLGGTTSIVAILRGTESYFTTPNDCFGWYNQDTWLSKK